MAARIKLTSTQSLKIQTMKSKHYQGVTLTIHTLGGKGGNPEDIAKISERLMRYARTQTQDTDLGASA